MDHLNYYSMQKDNFLEIDTSAGVYHMQGSAISDDPHLNSPTYLNEENSPKNGTKSSLYKTELCKRFSEFGNCRYGAKCQFAHGMGELRHVVRHPKYKTTKCKSYWGSGHCPYGSRCRFIHEEAESYLQPQFSPPSAMFLRERDHITVPSNPEVITSIPSKFGVNEDNSNTIAPNLSPYQKAPSSSSFNKHVWGSRNESKLNDDSEPTKQSNTSTPPNAAHSSTGYPDFQDAIDALMKFSLTSQDMESQSLGKISSEPIEAPAEPATKKSDYSLGSDELWKDFSSSSTDNEFAEKLQNGGWSSGLMLNLDSNPFESREKSESSSEKDDSPRLSIFERFH
jgi:hypothetical protein